MRSGYRGRMARQRENDACPGALQTHSAADGQLARIRLPGGLIDAAQLEAVALAAQDLGAPGLELTSRGNIQIRAVSDAAAVADRLRAAGLLPSPRHERVRNIVASPLSGRLGGVADVRAVTAGLDAAVLRDDRIVDLPGRFLFSIDDGRGDVSGLSADVGVHLVDERRAALLLAGRDTGVRIDTDDAVGTLLAVAHRFLDIRGKCWRVAELADSEVVLDGRAPSSAAGATWPVTTRPPVGWLEQTDGRITLGAAVPLGVLDAEVARYLAAVAAPMAVTPWRSVLLFDLDEDTADVALRVLAPLGLVFDENSPWLAVSACTGSPGCAQSVADVRADAAAALAVSPAVQTHRHFVGCDRACGSPAEGQVLIATGDGYRPRDDHP